MNQWVLLWLKHFLRLIIVDILFYVDICIYSWVQKDILVIRSDLKGTDIK